MLITFFQRKVTKVFLLIKYPSRFEHSLAGNEMESSTGEEVASLMIETEVTVPVNEEHVVAAVDNDDNPIALNESVPHRDLAEGASIDTGDTADTSASGQEVGENEPAAKRHKLDVVVPEDYVDEEEDFPADWKGEVEEEEEDEDEGFSITLGDTRPRIDVRKNLRKGGIDFNDVPEINGVPVTEFNIDTLEDKPWKKPGADLSDYFNYGFNEDTWRMYCDKQRNMRSEAHRLEHAHNQISTVSKNDNSKYGGPGGPGDEAPFRAQFRRRPNQDGGMMNQAGRERMLNPMMMRPGIMMMPGGMHGPGMMHPMGAPMNPMMMRPMGPMSLHAVPPPMRQQDQHSQQRRDQHGPDMGFRRNLATLTRIDTSGSQGDGSTS